MGVNEKQSQIIIFRTDDKRVSVDVRFDEDTAWLSLDQMAGLFERDKSTISRHIRNVFEEGELDRESVVANFATTAADGKTYQVDYYNLDVVISVGYRVKSLRGTQFRQWATKRMCIFCTLVFRRVRFPRACLVMECLLSTTRP